MKNSDKSQRNHNKAGTVSVMVADVSEALWRLRIAPTAAEMVRTLPSSAMLEDGSIDLVAATIDPR